MHFYARDHRNSLQSQCCVSTQFYWGREKSLNCLHANNQTKRKKCQSQALCSVLTKLHRHPIKDSNCRPNFAFPVMSIGLIRQIKTTGLSPAVLISSGFLQIQISLTGRGQHEIRPLFVLQKLRQTSQSIGFHFT